MTIQVRRTLHPVCNVTCNSRHSRSCAIDVALNNNAAAPQFLIVSDITAPTVTKLGDDTVDVSIAVAPATGNVDLQRTIISSWKNSSRKRNNCWSKIERYIWLGWRDSVDNHRKAQAQHLQVT